MIRSRARRIGKTSGSAGVPPFDGPAELPRSTVDVTYTLPPTQFANPANSAALTTALTSLAGASGNIYIVLNAGTTYTGPFTLPVLAAGTGWLYIISSALASLPAFGLTKAGRVTPANVANMPTIVGGGSPMKGFQTTGAVHHVRLVGLEIKFPAGDTTNIYTSLNRWGNGEVSLATLPNNIIVDRCYVHGDATNGGTRGLDISSATSAVVSSYFDDFGVLGADSQALIVINSPGPLRIENNHLGGAAEGIMFGGADPTIVNLIPSDIEIRANYLKKKTAWLGVFDIKNGWEIKSAKRVLFEKNVVEYVPIAQQDGFAVQLKSANQNDGIGATWTQCADVTVRYNWGVNVCNAVTILDKNPSTTSLLTTRVSMHDNVWEITRVNNGRGCFLQMDGSNGGLSSIWGQHDTYAITDQTFAGASGPWDRGASNKTTNFLFKNNMTAVQLFGGIKGSGLGEGTATLDDFAVAGYVAINNAIIASGGTYPATNIKPASNAVAMTNPGAGDYSAKAGGPCAGTASDGLDMGCSIYSTVLGYKNAALDPP